MDEFEKFWYSYHFGSHYVKQLKEDPDLFGQEYSNCFVLFADFCNFTKFLSSSDQLEDIEPTIRNYYSDSRKAIHKSCGMLDKIMGDGLLSIWGIHECPCDIESNIIKCVVELNKIGLQFSEEWQAMIDIEIRETGMRFGLSKGRLITIKRNDTYPGIAILGDPINMASRLQVFAKPQHLVCSNRAFNSLKHLDLDFVNQENIDEIKGFGRIKSHSLNLHKENRPVV